MTGVLVVDDARGRRRAVGTALADRGYDVTTAADTRVAVDRIREADPDVVVLAPTGGVHDDESASDGDAAAAGDPEPGGGDSGPAGADSGPAGIVERAVAAGPTPVVALATTDGTDGTTPDLDAFDGTGGVAVLAVPQSPSDADLERIVDAVEDVEGTPLSELATAVTAATARSVRRRVTEDRSAGAWTDHDRGPRAEAGQAVPADTPRPGDAGGTDPGGADLRATGHGTADEGKIDGTRATVADEVGVDATSVDGPGTDVPGDRPGGGDRAGDGPETAEGQGPSKRWGDAVHAAGPTSGSLPAETPAFEPPEGSFAPTVVIGASTGGPNVVETVLAGLPRSLDARVLVVQHMPASFTSRLATHLDEVSEYDVREATDGATVRGGEAVVARGGYHLRVDTRLADRLRVALTEEDPVHGVRPAVDVTMVSAAEHATEPLVGIVLTGMGRDGAAGVEALRAAGGLTLAQDRDSSAVFGMPEQAIATGAVDAVRPASEIPAAICDTLQEDAEP